MKAHLYRIKVPVPQIDSGRPNYAVQTRLYFEDKYLIGFDARLEGKVDFISTDETSLAHAKRVVTGIGRSNYEKKAIYLGATDCQDSIVEALMEDYRKKNEADRLFSIRAEVTRASIAGSIGNKS
jgi:hypothetical protein